MQASSRRPTHRTPHRRPRTQSTPLQQWRPPLDFRTNSTVNLVSENPDFARTREPTLALARNLGVVFSHGGFEILQASRS